MFRNRRCILAICVLALLAVPAPGLDGEEARASPPPPSGDWTVTDATSISSTTIVLTGDLTIMPGGILTLDTVVLVVGCTYGGEFGITVRSGGELHLRQSNLTASNLSRRFDLSAQAGSVLEMTRSEVHGAGSKWKGPDMPNGIMVRTGSASFTDTLFSNNTVALDIRNCSPTVTGCTFVDNRAAVVAYNSSMTIRDCSIGKSAFGGLILYDRTNITITNCVFTDNLYWGVYANHSSIILSGNVFHLNHISVASVDSLSLRLEDNTFTTDRYVSVSVSRCPSVYLDNDTIRGASRMGLLAEASRVSAVNSTFEGGFYDIQVLKSSKVELLNCTFARHKLGFKELGSRINVSWYIGALVHWWSDGTPVSGAEITVTNSTGNLTAKGITDSQGRFGWAVVQEYTLGLTVKNLFGPQNVTANKMGLTRTVGVTVNRSLEVDLLLDDIGPAIQVDFPQSGAFLNVTRVRLKGLSWDNETRVASIECRVDNGSYVAATGTSFWEFTTGILVNGPHSVTIRGRDTSNNTNQVTVAFTLDTFAPAVTITSPLDGGFTREKNVTVVGTTEKNATVTVNGTPVNVTAFTGAFNLTVELSEGDNFIEVVATDRAGNQGRKVVRFRKDTMVTPIDIFPRNGTWTNQTTVALQGRVEENSTMLIRAQDPSSNSTTNETRLNITTGNFYHLEALRDGTNLFRIDILDDYGNNATVYVTIIQDRSAPLLNLTSPSSDELYTRDRRLMLEGRTEPGASLFLNGRPVLVEDQNFSKALTLDLGENVLNVTAVDAAGNAVSLVFRAVLDRTPPGLEITKPKILSSGKQLRVDTYNLIVRGATEAEALVYITVNGEPVNKGRPVTVDAFGGFRKDVSLRRGKNIILVTAVDRALNPATRHFEVWYEPPPPLLSNEHIFVLVVVIGTIVGLLAVIAWDTKKSTGRWGIRRPAWFRVPEKVKERGRAIRAFVPRPEFGREEVEAGIGAIPAEPRKEGKEPEASGAPAPGAAPAPGETATGTPQPPPVPPIGKEFAVSEKPSAGPAAPPMPAASELPVAEPATGAPAPPAPAGPLPPSVPAAGPAPAPLPAAPPPPPPEPPKPKEVDPLAEIMGAPTRKL